MILATDYSRGASHITPFNVWKRQPLEWLQAVQHWMEHHGYIRTPSELHLTGDAR